MVQPDENRRLVHVLRVALSAEECSEVQADGAPIVFLENLAVRSCTKRYKMRCLTDIRKLHDGSSEYSCKQTHIRVLLCDLATTAV
jgi:hypothetical protein